ncbi:MULTISPECIES: hypothetical protein [unclassified Novosphingobium]|uniref:hypothetical protein n=1 Tax=unclassified Novosphingobium TaxID=2644732 RepID=UPI001358E127|nr:MULTISPECIES: hypothetical protein [unclassified Novosphingobium]
MTAALHGAIAAIIFTALLIGVAAWAQFSSPAASQSPQAEAHTPARIEAAAGDTGDVR